jgi:hypothetical protein
LPHSSSWQACPTRWRREVCGCELPFDPHSGTLVTRTRGFRAAGLLRPDREARNAAPPSSVQMLGSDISRNDGSPTTPWCRRAEHVFPWDPSV